MKDRLKKGFWNVLMAIAIIVLASMIISKAVTGWSSVFSYRMFYIMSESMEPVIAENSLAIGKVLSDSEMLQVGNIYAYKRDGILGQEIVIHRLIAIMEDGRYQFKGDNNELPDEVLVEREDIGYEIIGH
jgi:signal peptidase I|nr:MAG TPA: signal peptidase I, archaeal type [Caudoviricetes sp.]DAY33108.1 MAG TPA: signal peptidase I, archaeal type [Caudoviricetes sp.]